MKELRSITTVGLAAVFFIVAMKLIFGKFYVPGPSEVFSMV